MAASTFSDVIVSEDIRKRFLISSIVLGFTHLTFEIRQFIYDPIKWIIDPWNYLDLGAFLVPTITSIYWLVLENGTIAPNSSFVQKPDMNTNMFTDYGTSVLSMYLYLIGDPNALSNWEYKNNSQLTILMVLFSLLIAVYLMNLLIGLLSNAIEEDNNRVSYYHADVDETRRKIKELIKDGEWNSDKFSEMKQKLLNKLRIQDK
ncbi:16892_t:CDS:2 [Funneliformis mosseae]|uniref:16892_t:CDS:1 n=1 Tax=Funneliformis mosseae TaxID=27381 RepID=A0A9N9H584_FUNMO|nr:16892_t:CDS:2 [Funneliformis mosseae]